MFKPPQSTPKRRLINESQTSFPKGYISTLADSRIPVDGLADLTNMELVQDSLPRPRPSLIAYGADFLGTCIGIGTFVKIVDGLPERWEISMQNISGTGKIHVRKDGDSWTEVGGSYDDAAWTDLTQSNNRVYISNGVDNMSYYDIDSNTIVSASALATPSAPVITQHGMSGSNFNYYYKVTANNAFGETAASVADSEDVSLIRDAWDASTNYIELAWSAVTGALSYNVYMGDSSGNEYYLATVTGLYFKDDGTISPNIFRLYPSGDSTTGPILKRLVNSNGQLFGVGDVDNPSYLWYSGTGTHSGDFSPFNGGGFVAINYGGETIPVAVRSFRDGRGNPAITVLSKGAGGKGKLHHVTFESQTIGDTLIIFPNVYEANGQSGTISPRGVVEANNNLYYPTGDAFKSTGTKPSVLNILSTDNISQSIDPDVQNLNITAMENCVGLEYQGKIYWSLPSGTGANSEIWILDLTRKGLWILRWTVAAEHLWIYEDNDGITHFMALVDGMAMEFTRAANTRDEGGAFNTRVASGALTFDKSGMAMGSIEIARFKFLYPKGTIQVNVYGLGEDGVSQLISEESFEQQVSFTGFGQLLYSDGSVPSVYSDDVGPIDFTSQKIAVIAIEVDDILNELSWEILTDEANCDYFLSSVHLTGRNIDRLYYGD